MGLGAVSPHSTPRILHAVCVPTLLLLPNGSCFSVLKPELPGEHSQWHRILFCVAPAAILAFPVGVSGLTRGNNDPAELGLFPRRTNCV